MARVDSIIFLRTGIFISRNLKGRRLVASPRKGEILTEDWKYIEGSDNAYISTLGHIQRNGKDVIPVEDAEGYLRANVGKKRDRVHRYVALAFIPNPQHKPYVNHIDGNKKNNSVNNLEWVTAKENSEHASRTGLLSHDTGRKGAILAVNKKTGQSCVFLNQAHVAKVIGATDSEVNKCIKGKRKTVHGFTLEYISGALYG